MLKDPYENEEFNNAGLLLLSYPSIESFTISCFQDTDPLRVNYGKDVKTYISRNPAIQLNNIDEAALEHAASDFIRFLRDCTQEIDIDHFSPVSRKIFDDQEIEYMAGRGFRLFCTPVLLQYCLSLDFPDDFLLSPEYSLYAGQGSVMVKRRDSFND